MRNIMTVFFCFILLIFISFALDSNSLYNSFKSFNSTLAQQLSELQATTSAGTVSTVDGIGDLFSPSSCDDKWINQFLGVSGVISLWLAPSAFAGLIVLFGLACIYMLGQTFNMPNLTAIAKDEAFQTGLTFLRVGFIAGALVSGNFFYTLNISSISSSTPDAIYSNPDNVQTIDAALAFARLMTSDMVTHYSMLLFYNMIIHTIYSSTMWFGVTWRAMYSFNLGPVLKPIIDLIGSALQYLSLGITEWLLHIVTLCFIKKWMWGLFIPIGILLRAFPQTRNGGEAILSLGLTLALVYPYMFLFDYETHKVLKLTILDAEDSMDSFLQKSGLLKIFGSAILVMLLMSGVFIQFFLASALSLAFELIRGAVYYIIIMSIFMPFLNIFVTLTAAKETAEFFKADVNFLAFLKII